ncbi:MAG: hypothetical protein AB1499_03390, partial [Nitrospirota bacterium]
PEGGFYTSQDADVTPDDEGGYFTWTDEQLKHVLNNDEYALTSMHLMHQAGSMHHDASKKVLFQAMSAEEIAERTGRPLTNVIDVINSGKKRLLQARKERVTPYIDRTLYTSINGMMVSVFLQGFRILKDINLKNFALMSLEKILEKRLINNELFHAENVGAMLDDYAHLVEALLTAYEVTGNSSFIARAEELMKSCLDRLWDREEGGFFDTGTPLLDMNIKGVEDLPQPSANSVCIRMLLKLFSVTGKNVYFRYAEDALRFFSVKAGELGVHAGHYFSALDAYYNSLKLTLNSGPESVLTDTVISSYVPYADIAYADDKGHVVPCIGNVCYNPVNDPDALKDFLNNRRHAGN